MAAAAGSPWVKVAGLVGASGIALAAYGAHGLKTADEHYVKVFETANRQQMLAAPLLALAPVCSRRPHITGGLALAGVLLFSGSCYYCAVQQDRTFGKLAPYGGVALIAAWASLLLP